MSLRAPVLGSLPPARLFSRPFASTSAYSPAIFPSRRHKVVIVGGGSAGVTIGHQLLRSGKFKQDDISLIDPSEWHHYQPGWTLVGGGLKNKDDLRVPLASLVDSGIRHYAEASLVSCQRRTLSSFWMVATSPTIILLCAQAFRWAFEVSMAWTRRSATPALLSRLVMRHATKCLTAFQSSKRAKHCSHIRPAL